MDLRAGWKEGEDRGDGTGEAGEGGRLIGSMDQAGGDVAEVGGVLADELFGGLVEFVQLVLGDAGVEPGEA